MNTNTQVVTVEGEFDGLVVGGNYYEKGEARHSKSSAVRAEYWRARRAIRNSSYSLEDAPLNSEECDGKTVLYHDLKSRDE